MQAAKLIGDRAGCRGARRAGKGCRRRSPAPSQSRRRRRRGKARTARARIASLSAGAAGLEIRVATWVMRSERAERGDTAGGAYRRADRERQVGARARARANGSAASSSTPIPCRSIATCASSRRGRRRREKRAVPHRLYGHVDAAENYSVGRWLADAPAVLARRRAAGRLPILVGGTGLYFKALTQGLARGAADPGRYRASVRARLAAEGAARAACRARRAAMPARRHGSGRATAAHRARAGGAGGDRALARRLASRRHGRRCSTRSGREGLPRSRPRGAVSAHRRAASTPCWRPARSRRSARSMRAASIRCSPP